MWGQGGLGAFQDVPGVLLNIFGTLHEKIIPARKASFPRKPKLQTEKEMPLGISRMSGSIPNCAFPRKKKDKQRVSQLELGSRAK